jgi:hypothetical protein
MATMKVPFEEFHVKTGALIRRSLEGFMRGLRRLLVKALSR